MKIIDSGIIGEPLFKKYTTKIDNHSFRSDYAISRYKEFEQENSEYKGEDDFCNAVYGVKIDFKTRNLIKGKNTKGYLKELLLVLTQDLGHSRIRVCVEHYLR